MQGGRVDSPFVTSLVRVGLLRVGDVGMTRNMAHKPSSRQDFEDLSDSPMWKRPAEDRLLCILPRLSGLNNVADETRKHTRYCNRTLHEKKRPRV